jgi:uncharacterized protein YegL
MPDMVSESIVIVLDTSRSMYRSDYSPNRLEACKAGILAFVEARFNNDVEMGGSSSMAFVTFNDSAQTVYDFPDDPRYEQFAEALETITCGGSSSMGEGIGKAIKLLIEDIRRAGARVPRILIFSDGKYSSSRVDPLKMANLSSQLGMLVDTFRLGEVEHFNVMKRLSDITEGKYSYSNDSAVMVEAAKAFGESNIQAHGSNYQKGKGFNKILKKIAAPLMNEAEMSKGSTDQKDLISRIRGTKSFQKCSICFMSDDPISKTNFGVSGRYCANCAQAMHTSCASMWAKSNDKESDGTVFRCPHCFYLLSIPASVQTAVKMHAEVKKEIKKEASGQVAQSFNVSPVIAESLGEAAMYSACPVCNGIFDEDEQVVKCGNLDCNAIYHLSCFNKLNGICKSCGSNLTLR